MAEFEKLSIALKAINPEFLTHKLTELGGVAIKMINKTGTGSIKGTIVHQSSTFENSFNIESANGLDPIGIVYEDGVADGQECFIVAAGVAEVLLQDSTTATKGYWVKVSDTQAGRADATNISPPGGTIAAIEDHFSEIGHCREDKIAGVDVLAKIAVHFN